MNRILTIHLLEQNVRKSNWVKSKKIKQIARQKKNDKCL